MNTYYLRHVNEQALLDTLHAHGFFTEDTPNPYDMAHHNGADCVYLGKPVLSVDEDDSVVLSENYCANVISPTPLDFGDIETAKPNNPVNVWA